jgi:hypothetical protein
MDRLEEIIPKLFMAGAGVSIFTCLARADFNLPLFIFALFIWSDNDKRERLKLLGLMLLTFLVDFIWLCYWGPYWSGDESEWGQWEKGIHSFVVFLSAIGFILKAALIFAVCFVDKTTIQESLPSQIGKFVPFK